MNFAIINITRTIFFGILSLLYIPNGFYETDADIVNIKDYGAIGDGIHDDSRAIQLATNTGKTVLFDNGTYNLRSSILFRGRVHWKGKGIKSIIKSDDVIIHVENGSNSIIENLKLINRTRPTILIRDPSKSNSIGRLSVSDKAGYQPTVNDLSIWSKLSKKIQSQDIGPKILFRGMAHNILVDKIYGTFVSILINDAQNSVVRNCQFQGGKNVFGGLVFANLDKLGFGNRAIDNHISYASYCGIVFIGNSNGLIQGNKCEYNGESGIKLYQNTIAGKDARCYNMKIQSNLCQYNFYDGFDLQGDYPRNGLTKTYNYVYNNISKYNHATGYIVDGIGLKFIKNEASYNWGSGLNALNFQSLFSDNIFIDNNLSNTLQGVHQFVLTNGDRNIIRNNLFSQERKMGGYAIYDATGRNELEGNKAPIGSIFIGTDNNKH